MNDEDWNPSDNEADIDFTEDQNKPDMDVDNTVSLFKQLELGLIDPFVDKEPIYLQWEDTFSGFWWYRENP
jgi:hypothetical protein